MRPFVDAPRRSVEVPVLLLCRRCNQLAWSDRHDCPARRNWEWIWVVVCVIAFWAGIVLLARSARS